MNTASQLNWNPTSYDHLNGERYCSPACGGHCLREDYDRAVKLANALCKRLGDGWKPRVWENCGWHLSVEKGKLELHRNSARRYWANFGATARQFEDHGDTPEAAIESVLKMANEAVVTIQAELKEIRA